MGCGVSQGWHLNTHTHQTTSCSDTMGAGTTRARTSFTLSICLGSTCLATEVIQLSEMLLASGEGMFSIPQTPLKPQGSPQGQQPQLCYSDQSSPAALITPFLAIFTQILKGDLKGVPAMSCRYQLLKHRYRVHWSKYIIECIRARNRK